MIDNNDGPLMFIDTYKDELKINKVCTYDSRKSKQIDENILECLDTKNNIELGKIYKYNEKTIIPYKLQDDKIYGIVVFKVEGNICLELNESVKFEEIKL